MAQGRVRVDETGSVNQLTIENLGCEEVFVQAGDIVKGGKQDSRAVRELRVAAEVGKTPIAAFCVEHGRWRARGGEDVTKFASSGSAVPSRKAKLAMRASVSVQENGLVNSETNARQQEVWKNVAQIQGQALRQSWRGGCARRSPRAACSSRSKTKSSPKCAGPYNQESEGSGRERGRHRRLCVRDQRQTNAADVYPSNGLSAKCGEVARRQRYRSDRRSRRHCRIAPKPEEVLAFLDGARAARQRCRTSAAVPGSKRAMRPERFTPAASPASGGFVHKNYLMK